MTKFNVGDRIAYPDWDEEGAVYGTVRVVLTPECGSHVTDYCQPYLINWDDPESDRTKEFTGSDDYDDEEYFYDNELVPEVEARASSVIEKVLS